LNAHRLASKHTKILEIESLSVAPSLKIILEKHISSGLVEESTRMARFGRENVGGRPERPLDAAEIALHE
jgi:hypothetical protein